MASYELNPTCDLGHKLNRQHVYSGLFICNICRGTYQGPAHHCSYCNYDLCAKCYNQQKQSKNNQNCYASHESNDSTLDIPDPTKVYQLGKQLGQGTYGKVYQAKHRKSKKIVAIKKLPISDEKEFKALVKEVSHLMDCESKYIIRMMDTPYFEVTSQGNYWCWVVLEYCDGGSIERLIKKCNKDIINKIIHDTLKGLKHLHSKGIIHRDVKPDNILFDSESSTFKLGDLGIAKKIESSQSNQTQTMIGTAGYQAPEIEEGKYTNAVDIYSWGRTIMKLAAKDSLSKDAKKILGLCCSVWPETRPSAPKLYAALCSKSKSKNQDDQKDDY